jgi:hypothetical protein
MPGAEHCNYYGLQIWLAKNDIFVVAIQLTPHISMHGHQNQGDQIGWIFAYCAIECIGLFFFKVIIVGQNFGPVVNKLNMDPPFDRRTRSGTRASSTIRPETSAPPGTPRSRPAERGVRSARKSPSWDRFYKAPFRPKTFRINFILFRTKFHQKQYVRIYLCIMNSILRYIKNYKL